PFPLGVDPEGEDRMPAVELFANREAVATSQSNAGFSSEDAIADRVATFSAMGGSVMGVAAGAILASAVGASYPLVFGTIGAAIGSAAAACAGQFAYLSVRRHRGRHRV